MKMKSCLLALFCFVKAAIYAQNPMTFIFLDQEGFYPNAQKIAIVAGPVHHTQFVITRDNGWDTVFRGELSAPRQSKNSDLQTRTADFSKLTKTGTFMVSILGCCQSYPFRIGKKIHQPAAISSLKAFYYQRASMALEKEYAGLWKRDSGHPDDSVIIHPSAASRKRLAGSYISTPGGWYDAGDYNKYVVNAGISTATLLSAYEDFSTYFDSLKTNISSIGPGIPDLLNEVLYNLRWMLSMQDPEDGGVYTKCTNANFDPMIMPAAARQKRYVVQKSTAATLDFAAVTAQAARILKPFKKELPGLADSCFHASVQAWNWSVIHPAIEYNQDSMNRIYEPKIKTGGYGDKYFSDEWFWAGSELLISTGENKYRKVVLQYFDEPFGLPSWSSTGMLGYYSLLRNQNNPKIMPFTDSIRSRLTNMADEYIQEARENAFLTVMGTRRTDFVWGSNAVAANQGVLLIQVYLFTHDRKYLNAALGNLEYLCGRNATGYCFITGIGSFSTQHPHHRPSIADGIMDPVPGLLAGGPNPGEQDHCKYEFHDPETAYVDSDCAYASNEIAINWNAPLVYLANAIEALQDNF